ncbi:MAG TPA: DUF4326 domain-containing protein [Actinocrinis sp.]|nr:DUF4326 domain-containing protein [Actinocrinis sp.]
MTAPTRPTQGALWTTTLPTRIRLRRTRGWRLQAQAPGAIVVRRPSRYGNPFTVTDALAEDPTLTHTQARARCTRLFALWLDGEITLTDPTTVARRAWILDHLPDLTGHPLACSCPHPDPGQPDHCHAAHLIERSNTRPH